MTDGLDADLSAEHARLNAEILAATTLETLRSLEVRALGQKGEVQAHMRKIPQIPPEQRKAFGQAVNTLQRDVTAAIEARRTQLVDALIEEELHQPIFTPEILQERRQRGHQHPVSTVQLDIEGIFHSMGFHVLDYPEIESEFDNFEALNIPGWHPAREMQDTFWLGSAGQVAGGHLLRTHTSAGQVRAMHTFPAPFRAIFPGKVYRYEATDASHEHTFHQVEGLMIDRKVSVGHLLDSMRTLLSAILQREVEIRLRPGYFPFTEPGFELDIRCQVCQGQGCSACKRRGWLELLPCGLVHPNVLRAGGLDPNEWQGWAFGLGLSRLVMMRYGVPDVRQLLSGDLRFLSQF